MSGLERRDGTHAARRGWRQAAIQRQEPGIWTLSLSSSFDETRVLDCRRRSATAGRHGSRRSVLDPKHGMKRTGRETSKSRREIRDGAAEKQVGHGRSRSWNRQEEESSRDREPGRGLAGGKNRGNVAGPFSMTRRFAGGTVSRGTLLVLIRHGGAALVDRGEIGLIRLHPPGSGAYSFTAQVASEGKSGQSGQQQCERDDEPASALHDGRRQPGARSVHSWIGCQGSKVPWPPRRRCWRWSPPSSWKAEPRYRGGPRWRAPSARRSSFPGNR